MYFQLIFFSFRYESVSDNLEKSERERLFDEHVDALVAKKKENFRRMLDDCKAITLESSFKDIKKLIKDDPRYAKYSSSERKCEKQFNDYMKDRYVADKILIYYPSYPSLDLLVCLFFEIFKKDLDFLYVKVIEFYVVDSRIGQARMAYKQLLMETKKITDKSLQLVRDSDSGHLAEIEEVLSKDRRYLDLDGFKDERTAILMDYLEEVERRGPPPPPTASEPIRRSIKP